MIHIESGKDINKSAIISVNSGTFVNLGTVIVWVLFTMIRVMVVLALLARTFLSLTNGALVPMVRQINNASLLNNSSKTESELLTMQMDLKQQSGITDVTIGGETKPLSTPSTSSPSFREEVLRLHNQARRETEPPAANMPLLSWSSELAYLAKLWSRRCAVDYGLPLASTPLTYNGRILQNVWSGRQMHDGAIEGAVSSWLAEGREFNYDTGACYRAGGCRHYQTMTSAMAREIGCDSSKCHDDDINIVCYYGTGISSQGSNPPSSHYDIGQPCSKCGPEDWCDGGLCRSQVKQWKRKSVDNKCQCGKMEDTSSLFDSVSDSSPGSPVILYRHRRQATNGSTTTTDKCGNTDIALWIFVGLLVFVVFLGLAIGTIAMLVCICKELCTSCIKRREGCCSNCCEQRQRGNRRMRSRCCCFSSSVEPLDEPNSDEDTPDGPPVRPPALLGNASINTEETIHRDVGINTEPQSTIEAGTCTEPLVIITEECESNDAGVQVKPETGNAENQADLETNDVETQVDLETDDKEVQADPETEDAEVQVDTMDSPSSPPSLSSSVEPGRCLRKGCTTCPLHTMDQREVNAERIETVREVIRANRDPSLKPGDRIF